MQLGVLFLCLFILGSNLLVMLDVVVDAREHFDKLFERVLERALDLVTEPVGAQKHNALCNPLHLVDFIVPWHALLLGALLEERDLIQVVPHLCPCFVHVVNGCQVNLGGLQDALHGSLHAPVVFHSSLHLHRHQRRLAHRRCLGPQPKHAQRCGGGGGREWKRKRFVVALLLLWPLSKFGNRTTEETLARTTSLSTSPFFFALLDKLIDCGTFTDMGSRGEGGARRRRGDPGDEEQAKRARMMQGQRREQEKMDSVEQLLDATADAHTSSTWDSIDPEEQSNGEQAGKTACAIVSVSVSVCLCVCLCVYAPVRMPVCVCESADFKTLFLLLCV